MKRPPCKHHQTLIKISLVFSNNIFSLFKIKSKWSSISTLQVKVKTSLCFLQSNWSYVFWNIFKIGTYSILGMYLIFTILSMLWIKLRSLSARGTLEPAKTHSKYFVLNFHCDHRRLGRNLYDQKILWNWIPCLTVKWP